MTIMSTTHQEIVASNRVTIRTVLPLIVRASQHLGRTIQIRTTTRIVDRRRRRFIVVIATINTLAQRLIAASIRD
jgi:hypothetical protein